MKIGYVYMITSPSGRIYIGSTCNISKRWGIYKRYNCKGQIKIYNSFIKYGVNNHIFEVIWTGNSEEMLNKECVLGHFYDVLNKDIGLNLKLPNCNEKLSCISEETKNKMRKSGIKRMAENKKPVSEISRHNMSLGQLKRYKDNKGVLMKKGKTIKSVVCTITNKEFASIKEASIYYNLKYETLQKRLRGEYKNNTSLIYKVVSI